MTQRTSLAATRIQQASRRPSGGRPSGDVIALDMGEPDFDTPEVIINAAIDALRSGHTHYADMNGDPELRALIAAQATELAGTEIDPTDVLVSHGGAAGITAAVLAVVDPGDRVLLPEPTYSLYVDAVALAGGIAVPVPLTSDHHLDLDAIAAESVGARLLIVCNPSNPTGAVLGASELAALPGVLDDDTLVLVDEAYGFLVYGDEPFVPALAVPELLDRLIYVQTLSKTYAMTGWRIGYVIGPKDLMPAVRLVHRTMNSAINSAVQRAAIVALTEGDQLATPMLEEYRRRRQFVVERVAQIDGASMVAPEGAFYALIKYPGDLPSADVVALLRDGGVAVRAGAEYGPSGEGHVRLSFAADIPTLTEGFDRLERVFKSL